MDNVGPERGLVGDLINVNTRNEGKYVGNVYNGCSEINILYIQHLVSRV